MLALRKPCCISGTFGSSRMGLYRSSHDNLYLDVPFCLYLDRYRINLNFPKTVHEQWLENYKFNFEYVARLMENLHKF